jgi:hypothetical protein
LVGSSTTSLTPRGVQGVVFVATAAGFALAQSAALAEPP